MGVSSGECGWDALIKWMGERERVPTYLRQDFANRQDKIDT